jgi:hypothetical protein
MRRQLLIGVMAFVALSMLAACGDSDDDDDTVADVSEANAEFCQDLGVYGDAVAALAALDPATATKADYDTAADAVRSARSDLSESGADLAEAEFENLEAQAEDLDGLLEDAPDDAVVADILSDAQVQAAEVGVSVATLNTAVCTVGGGSTTTPASSTTAEG